MPDSVKDDLELGIVLLLQFVEPASQILVGGNHLAEPHEDPHDFDVHSDGPLASQDAGEHRHSLFSEHIRQVLSVATASHLQGCNS